ncbi:MAG: type II toxin-antitoxin system RelE/ParE family toxin [Bacteroidota bacterium]|nr:type II toxin-antitoxin system RelE/ParE family toxin [Bacteroidota bacterium]
MKFEIAVLDAAEDDIDNSYFWYESQQPGLGDMFIKFFNQTLEFISSHPAANERKHKNVRRCVMEKFPFGVYYQIESDKKEIRVIGVIHFKRNPKVWMDRI